MIRFLCTLLTIIALTNSLQAINLRLISKVDPVRSEVYSTLFFDHSGLLWIGSHGGLRCYDGDQVQTFQSNAYSPGLLPNNRVQSIAEDHDNRLWIGTNNGLACLNMRTGRFKTYHLPADNQRIIYMLYVDSHGTLWAGTDCGLSFYRPETDDFYTYNNNTARFSDIHGNAIDVYGFNPKAMAEDSQGNLYVGTWSTGLFTFQHGSNEFTQYAQTNEKNSAFSLLVDSRDRLWIGTWGCGIERLDNPRNPQQPGLHQWNQQNQQNFSIYYRIVEDPVSNSILAVTRTGLSVISLTDEDERIENIADICSQKAYQYTDIATDGHGNIWISAWNDGIFHFTTTEKLFKFHGIGQSDIVSSIYTADGSDFWLGLLPVGLAHYDSQSGHSVPGSKITAINTANPLFATATVPTISPRPDGSLWFGSSSYGICELQKSGEVRNYVNATAPFLPEDYITATYTTRSGHTLIGTRRGVGVAQNGEQGDILTMSADGDDFSFCDVRCISEALGSCWLATDNEGIIRISGDLSQPSTLTFKKYDATSGRYALDNATCCMEDSQHRLWAISSSGGLFLYDATADRFNPMNHVYHLWCGKLFAMAEDNLSNLWLTSEQGMARLSISGDEATITTFAEEDGLGDFVFSANGMFQHGSQLYVGTRGGFLSFQPDAIDSLKPTPHHQLVVTNILIDGHPLAALDSAFAASITELSPGFTRDISIPASVEKIAVEFALLNYAHRNRCAYRLEGYNDDWQHLSGDGHQASFENMPSGSYKLRLKAADSYGKWVEMPYSISINVLPPWYATPWAYAIYVLLIASAVWGITVRYKENLKTKNRLQMTRVFTSITHELLTPLAVISASTEELRTNAPEYASVYDVMQNNINRLTRMLRQILEVRKSQAGQLKLKVSQQDMTEFVTRECANLQPMAAGKNQQMIVSTTGELTDAWFDADKLDKIIYNLVSNAVKYNKEGKSITITLSRKKDMAVLEVADEGIGMSKETMKHLYTRFLDGDYRRMGTHGTGIGLSLTHDLVTLHHGTIHCESLENVGTTFRVELPIARQAYADIEIDTDPQTSSDARTALTDVPANLPAPEESAGEYTLLIVEDNTELLQLMQRLLSRQYRVLTAKNGQLAWNIIQKEELDIVISDVMMPIMDGLELTRKIKESDDFAQLPVILLTAKTRTEDRNEAYKVGADAYITKPVSMQDLQIRVGNILKNRELIRQRFRRLTDFKVEEQHYSSPDEMFVLKAIDCVKNNMMECDRETLAADMAVSSSTLYKKLRAITGQNINSFIMSVRLKEACRILRESPDVRINELCLMVGISTPKYFTKQFKEEFGMTPSEYVDQQKGA